jgi:hypothetical protein
MIAREQQISDAPAISAAQAMLCDGSLRVSSLPVRNGPLEGGAGRCGSALAPQFNFERVRWVKMINQILIISGSAVGILYGIEH